MWIRISYQMDPDPEEDPDPESKKSACILKNTQFTWTIFDLVFVIVPSQSIKLNKKKKILGIFILLDPVPGDLPKRNSVRIQIHINAVMAEVGLYLFLVRPPALGLSCMCAECTPPSWSTSLTVSEMVIPLLFSAHTIKSSSAADPFPGPGSVSKVGLDPDLYKITGIWIRIKQKPLKTENKS